jgi:predicted ribosome quality control (RQC) complex YloA/Tae2 family protein
MKLYELQAIAKRLSAFNFITRARRVENNTLELSFDKADSYFFNLTRGHSHAYKAPSQRPLQGFNAPFDTLLHTLVSASKLIHISTPNDDRVLRFELAPKSSYKDKRIYLQLEFTGKNTNAILLDENEVIIEALRHIDADSSFRVIRPGVELLPIPARETRVDTGSTPTASTLNAQRSTLPTDIDIHLENIHTQKQQQRIAESKKVKQASTLKKIQKISKELEKLPNSNTLEKEAEKHQKIANIILSNLHKIKPYDKTLNAYDFEGQEVTIPLPKNTVVNRMSEYYFNLSKRAKSKAKNIHIEQDNLESKKAFYENILYAIENATTLYDLELLVPKRGKQQRKKEKMRFGELFWIEDYKVMVGRNSNENQKLLQAAKGNDIWMHTREIPGSHVFIRTDKQNLPDSVIEAAAKLCVDFSAKSPGDYLVDYTKRKFVKIQEGSNVEYDKYQTIAVRKDGIEIRE